MTDSLHHRDADRGDLPAPPRKPLSVDYFDLQLQFARVVSDKTGVSLAHAIFTHTNFYMRLSFGTRQQLNEDNPAWRDFIGKLADARDQTACVYQAYLGAQPQKPQSPFPQFGCFSFDPVADDGSVRFHFANNEIPGQSPLATARIDIRRQELRQMFTTIVSRYPDVKTVKGNSWLYHLASYRRLFPHAYGESRAVVRHSDAIQGTSRWGQFLDRNGQVVDDIRRHFLANLKTVAADRLIDAFPIPTYRTQAPVTDFIAFLGLAERSPKPDRDASMK